MNQARNDPETGSKQSWRILKMETTYSETSVEFQVTTWCYIIEAELFITAVVRTSDVTHFKIMCYKIVPIFISKFIISITKSWTLTELISKTSYILQPADASKIFFHRFLAMLTSHLSLTKGHLLKRRLQVGRLVSRYFTSLLRGNLVLCVVI
jgi:hypothetical protein